MCRYSKLKAESCYANLLLPKYNIVYFTWGNVSVYDKDNNVIAIKPSGVSYETLNEDDIVVVDLAGNTVEGNLKPSSDLHTHLELYRNFDGISAVVHTHSAFACGWAQAGKDLDCLGTTHADSFYGSVPCTRSLTEGEIHTDYELNTGKVIVECFQSKNINPIAVPGVLVKNHGPFTWGQNSQKAVEHAVTLEIVAQMNTTAVIANPSAKPVSQGLLDKHYNRKHGPSAYYGQNSIK